MAKLLKAMKRPAALWGVPMVASLAVTGVTIIVAVWTSVALLFLLPVEFLVMKSLTGEMNQCGSIQDCRLAESEGKTGSKPFIWRNNTYAR